MGEKLILILFVLVSLPIIRWDSIFVLVGWRFTPLTLFPPSLDIITGLLAWLVYPLTACSSNFMYPWSSLYPLVHYPIWFHLFIVVAQKFTHFMSQCYWGGSPSWEDFKEDRSPSLLLDPGNISQDISFCVYDVASFPTDSLIFLINCFVGH